MNVNILYCSFEECYNLPERNGICASHNHAARKAERELLKPKKQPKPLPKRSDKKVKEDREYTVLKKEQLEEHPECQIKIIGICLGKATDVHHSGKRGVNYLKKELFLSGCRPCHDHVEFVMSAKERRDKGFLI